MTVEVDFRKGSYAYNQNLKVLMDTDDYEKLFKGKNIVYIQGHAMCNNKLVHRTILGLTDSNVHVDHINQNGLDNRKSNLRKCTPQENAYNKSKYKNNTTGLKGVHYYERLDKFMAYISADKKRKHLGYFETKEEAYKAYVQASKALHKDFAPQEIQFEDGEPVEPPVRQNKSSKYVIANYWNNRDEKLRKQIIRNIKKYGKEPKPSTIEKHNLTPQEIQDAIREHQEANQN